MMTMLSWANGTHSNSGKVVMPSMVPISNSLLMTSLITVEVWSVITLGCMFGNVSSNPFISVVNRILPTLFPILTFHGPSAVV